MSDCSEILESDSDSKADASAQVQEVLTDLLADLARLGVQVQTPENTRAALTWSTQSLRTQQQDVHDKTTGEHGPFGADPHQTVGFRRPLILSETQGSRKRHRCQNVRTTTPSVLALA
ncbi:hypothetical protein ABIB25_002063 [Nakamurella sp. UYEF19]